jgi:hypothetical protein
MSLLRISSLCGPSWPTNVGIPTTNKFCIKPIPNPNRDLGSEEVSTMIYSNFPRNFPL